MMIRKSYHKAFLVFALILSLGPLSAANAQGVFEGSGEEDNSGCVGDGCGLEFNVPEQNSTEQANENQVSTADSVETENPGTAESPKDSIQSAAADSTKEIEFFDDEDSRPTFVNESASDYQARKEGFSKSIQFGFRVGAGINMNFLGKKVDGWNVGLDLEAGAIAKLPLGNDFSAAAGLDYSYRTYSYEANTDYGHNEANLSVMLFEIPVFLQYTFDEDGFFVGLGGNVGLKMSGETEFKQTNDIKKKKETRNNTMPTAGIELGGLLNIGYVIHKNCVLDLRLVQNLTNLLNRSVIAESSLMKTTLYTSHATLGFTFLL